MISHGDELGRSQAGNNNGFCQDNEITWVGIRTAGRASGLSAPPVLQRCAGTPTRCGRTARYLMVQAGWLRNERRGLGFGFR